MEDIIDIINKESQEYYDKINSASLKPLMRWRTNDLDSLDGILDELKTKKPALNLPDKTTEEDDLTALMNERLMERRALERAGKIKVRI